MPEIEARLKAKCDRLVSAFEIDEAGECSMYLIRDWFLFLMIKWLYLFGDGFDLMLWLQD